MTIVFARISDAVKGSRDKLATLHFQQRDEKVYTIPETSVQAPTGEILKLSAIYDTASHKLSLSIVSKECQVLRVMTDWVGTVAYCLFRYDSDAFELYFEKNNNTPSGTA